MNNKEIESRVTAIEVEVASVREIAEDAHANAAAARALASGAHTDVADVKAHLRAQTSTLNALRETQAEHSQTLARHERILNEHTAVLNEHSGMLSKLVVGMNQITKLLTRHLPDDDKDQAGR